VPEHEAPAAPLGRRLVVGITGATGAIYGIRLLEAARALGVETHVVISEWGRRTIQIESAVRPDEVLALGSVTHDPQDLGAPIGDPGHPVDGMAIVPCSMRTLAGIANGIEDNLIHRAAEATLTSGRPLVLAVRESPLSPIHLENLLRLARRGAIIAPPVPAFYTRPGSVDDIVDQTVGRLLDLLGFEHDRIRRWGTPRATAR
jgi:4-hydroxy-3-polyprenylbenzoate decarboxylase